MAATPMVLEQAFDVPAPIMKHRLAEVAAVNANAIQ